ncbi:MULTISPECIES: hypothetical protein [Streptosporangium]|uniref:NBD/HSP70 family sugar kinase n=1 Tax=Streptosporangium brasiliense TaxID=47480 RepID=A0ABT9R709_9ACTN|nr:hypothetical protein [Streptosporangium brasiliense]MDP9865034.1 putative NBD/HSP70 family sugar kinase [Streptosporangium brasiliense]
MSGSVLAVDIGGTKFAVALVDPDGNVRATRRAATSGPCGRRSAS